MIESPKDMTLTREGRIECYSGKLVFLSPCVMHGYGRRAEWFNEFDGTALIDDPNRHALHKLEMKRSSYVLNDVDALLKKAEACEKIPRWPRKKLDDLDARIKDLKDKVEEKVREHKKRGFFIPPNMVQGRLGVYHRMEGGNTAYVITEKDGRFKLHTDAPLPKRRTIGKVLAYASLVLIADAQNVRIVKRHLEDVAILEAEKGFYSCGYTSNKNTILISPEGEDHE